MGVFCWFFFLNLRFLDPTLWYEKYFFSCHLDNILYIVVTTAPDQWANLLLERWGTSED